MKVRLSPKQKKAHLSQIAADAYQVSPRAEMLYPAYQYHIDNMIKTVKFKREYDSEKP
jgi:hypothetical protein